MNTEPLLSFVVPTKNRLKYLMKTIDSLLKQSDKSFEIIVSDNQSSDGTASWLIRQERVRVVQPRKELAMFDHWNFAASFAVGEFVAIVSDDDLVGVDTVRELRRVLKVHPTIGMLVCDHWTVDDEDNPIDFHRNRAHGFTQAVDAFRLFRYGVKARVCAVSVRRSVFQELDGFNSHFKTTAADSELIQKVSCISPVYFSHQSSAIASYRVWRDSATSFTISTRDWDNEIQVWGRNIRVFAEKQGLRRTVRLVPATLLFDNRYSALLNQIRRGSPSLGRDAFRRLRSCRPVRPGRVMAKYLMYFPWLYLFLLKLKKYVVARVA